MLGLILASLTGFFLFSFISIAYLPKIRTMEERAGVEYARKKLKWLSEQILKSLDVKLDVKYKNREAIDSLDKKEGVIFVCNHQSNLDIPAIVTALHMDVGFVAKHEMKRWPFFGTWMKKSNCVFLNRENPREGIKDIKKAVESSAKELGIEVPEDEVDKLVTMMQKVSKVDVNVDALKKQAGEIYNKLKDAGIDLSNVDTKGLAQKIGDFFANIFEAIVRFFSGLFG